MSNRANNITTVVPCDECRYLKECRAVLKCEHPYGLKSPSYDSYCSYGEQKEEVTNENKTD
jgi:hypothetical protein